MTANAGFVIVLMVIVLHMLVGRAAEKVNFRIEVPFFTKEK